MQVLIQRCNPTSTAKLQVVHLLTLPYKVTLTQKQAAEHPLTPLSNPSLTLLKLVLVLERVVRTQLTVSTNYITSVSTLVGADEALDAQIKTNADAISSEASTRASADTTLQSNIDSEASTRSSADTTLQSNIDAEETARQAADSTLQTNIDDEETARTSADTTLQSNIDAEETARIAAVSGEATARSSADTTLQSNIDAEASTRAAAVFQP